MPELKFIVKNANGRILFKDAGGNIIQDRPDYEAVGLTGELYPESITVGAGENTYSFVIPANGGITYTTAGGTPTSYTGNAAGLLTILSANFFNTSTGSGGGGGGGTVGGATAAKQDEQTTALQSIQTNTALTRLYSYRIDQNTQQLVQINDAQALAIGQATDLKALDPNDNASLVSLSKGQLENLASMQAVLGYGGSPIVIDPALGGTIPGILKGLLSVAGLTIGQKIDLGLFPGVSTVHKSGKNFDVDTATLPESVWNGGGFYTGFPLTHTTTVEAVSSSASDVGVLTVIYLETENSTDYTTATIPVNGTTPQTSGFNVYRIHSASYASTVNIGTRLNVGTITVRSSANPLTVFIAIPIGGNQSYMSGYTIPKGKKGYIMPTKWRAGGTAGGQIECVMFIRPKGGALRFRRNCTATVGAPVTDEFDGFIVAEEGTDIMPTIKLATANNITAEASYDIILLPA
jgi:hypothetical protein